MSDETNDLISQQYNRSVQDQIRSESDSVIELVKTLRDTSRDIAKLRLAYWDKTVILNAGTLALSFTAVTSFRGHVIGDGGVGYLFASWKFFIASIILSLLAQWLATQSLDYAHVSTHSTMMSRRLDRIKAILVAHKVDFDEGELNVKKLADAATKSLKYFVAFEKTARWIGICSQVCTAIGLLWLYNFAHVNLRHL